jgi:hypothetical protein
MANQNPAGSATAFLAATAPNTNYTIYETNLLQGFYDPDGDSLSVTSLSAENGEINDLGNGQWQFVPDQNFYGAVTLSYLVGDRKGGDTQGTLSFNITAPQTAPTGNVTISGTPQQNQTLSANNTLADSNGLGAINYSWLSNGNVVSNQPSYTLTQNDVGIYISVTASYTDGLGKLESVSSQSVLVRNVNDFPTGNVTISGNAAQGQTLTASNTLADLDGLGTVGYQWLRDGNVISTQSNYTLTASDVGKAISVRASYTDLQGTAESVTSNPTSLIMAGQTAPTGNVTILGTAQQNQTLSANNTLADSNGLGAINYSWLSNGAFVSNQSSYTLTQNDVGKNISVTASYTDGVGKLESMSSQSVLVSNVNDFPTGNVTISGATTQGQTLTASNNLADLDGLGTVGYQWLRDGNVISTQSNYTLTTSDVGKAISVKANYTDLQGTAESVTSNPTSLIMAGQTPPTGNVTILGTATQGQTLTANTANLADANGLGTFSYQWLVGSSVVSTQPSYLLMQTDVNKNIVTTQPPCIKNNT